MTDAKLQWLHISDLHFKGDDKYDREVILTALLESLPQLAERGCRPDYIFVTGDIANWGLAKEYAAASVFFDELLRVTKLSKAELFVVPGNHDVDRKQGKFLNRTLDSVSDSDDYFATDNRHPHVLDKQKNFIDWHNKFFEGVRSIAVDSSVLGVDEVRSSGIKLRVIRLNTALFCQGDDDHGKLWLGRRCLNKLPAKEAVEDGFTVGLMHHPLDWLHEAERTSTAGLVRERCDFILRGHLHETDVESVAGLNASSLHLAAGATYQTEKYPNRAMFAELTERELSITPIRYDSSPKPCWALDTSIFPSQADYTRSYPHARSVIGASVAGGEIFTPGRAQQQKAIEAREAFEQDLFVTGTNERLYAEPRIMDKPQDQALAGDQEVKRVTIDDIVTSSRSFQIEAPSEFGATSLSRRLAMEFADKGVGSALVYDAAKLPNYRKKLAETFKADGLQKPRILILDNFDYNQHERLLKEVVSLAAFERLIVLASDKGLRQTSLSLSDSDDDRFDRAYLWALGRSEIRELARVLFDSGDEQLITSIVDKVYGDLLALCIPLTPANVLMYIRVLKREDDFYPLNRVDILDRYLGELLRKPSDSLNGSFSARNKLNLLASFFYTMFSEEAAVFSDGEWRTFCRRYKADKLCDFDEDQLLKDLLSARIVIGNQNAMFVKYSFFYNYFVGRHLSNSQPALNDFISNKRYYALPGVVESASGLVADNSVLLKNLTDELNVHLSKFFTEYMKESFDPFSEAIWIDDESSNEKFWKPIERQIEAGPLKATEIDLLKTSALNEVRTEDQQVRFERFAELEHRMFLTSAVLADAIKGSDAVDGTLKVQAVSAIYRCTLAVMQIGSQLAPVIAQHRLVRWGGLSFINWSAKPREDGDHRGVLWVLGALCRVVGSRSAESIGVKKLGEVFKAIDKDVPDNSFLKLQNFISILSAKPDGWVEMLRGILEKADRRGYYFMQMLLLLFNSFKNDIHTHSDRQHLKSLIAYIKTKRDLKVDAPGNKAVNRVLGVLEEQGHFKPDAGKP